MEGGSFDCPGNKLSPTKQILQAQPLQPSAKKAAVNPFDELPEPPTQPIDAGYNAYSGGLPPGALPPGVTLPGITDGRTTAQGYAVNDGIRQQFAGQIRDSESGLDYVGARYYNSGHGRFTSPDPLYITKQRLGDPQQWNLYAYARNNPLKYVDPTGLDIEVTGNEQDEYIKRLQKNVSFKIQLNAKTDKVAILGKDGKELSGKELSAVGKGLKGAEKELFNAIVDAKNHVTIDTTRKDPGVDFGRFDGNGKNTIDFADVDLLDSSANAGGLSSSQVVGHETLEAYASSKGDKVGKAHDFANKFFPGLEMPDPATVKIFGNSKAGVITRASAEFPIHNSQVRALIIREFVTPIPINSIPQGNTPANIVGVQKKP